jgi:ATP-dependent Lon protease
MARVQGYIPGWDLPEVNRELLTDDFGLVNDSSLCAGTICGLSRVFIKSGGGSSSPG